MSDTSIAPRVVLLKISRTAGKKRAAVAIARKLLVIQWHMVRKNQPYQPHAAPGCQTA